jgi:hypothetical protein
MAARSKIAAIVLGLVTAGSTLLADTLVLRDGRRVQGELIGVYGREIEFEERGGFNRRVIRIPRQDIARIEFDNQGQGGGFGRQEDNVSGGIPRGMRERTVNVTARETWTDTGIDVRAGSPIYFMPSGEWRWGPNRRDGAAGESDSPFNRGRPMPNQPAAALIGRIGEDPSAFIIGSDPRPVRARASGRLYLGINDDVLNDNTGSLRVVVAY